MAGTVSSNLRSATDPWGGGMLSSGCSQDFPSGYARPSPSVYIYRKSDSTGVRHIASGMKRFLANSVTVLGVLLAAGIACAQRAPASPSQPWQGTMQGTPPARSTPAFAPDPTKTYTLPELVNLAEQNNPETRVAWENAKARAADLGISKATSLSGRGRGGVAQSARDNLFFAPNYYRQTVESFSPALELDYTIFDFGRRLDEIAISRNNLLAANFLFNDTHRKVIFQVMAAYYRVLNAKGQEDAAEANLKNAQTVQQAAEARLELGLATLPDVLEARSAAAQADYDLQAAIGASEIAHGDLATALGISPTSQLQVESIQALTIPQDLTVTVETSIDRALAQRPDLMQRVAELRAARAEVKAAKTAYLPTLSVSGGRRPGQELLRTGSGARRIFRQSGVLECATEPDLGPL